MNVSRRHFMKTAGAVSLGFTGMHLLFGRGAWAQMIATGEVPLGFGELVPDPAGIFDLPKGFSYRVISQLGEQMSDGLLVSGACDGMAAFPGPGGKTILVRNHELTPDALKVSPFGPDNSLLAKLAPEDLYDYGRGVNPSLGGTSTLVFDTKTQKLEKQFQSLAGTVRNCAGGPTPWGSWLTCEETTVRTGENYEKDHGYVFDVPATAEVGLARPVPIKAMGRFSHEAVAVDPRSGIVYETEDTHDSLIYRYIPNTPGELHKGGRLQALVVKDKKSLDTRNWPAAAPAASADGAPAPTAPPYQPAVRVGEVLDVEWIDMDEVESPKDDLRLRGFEAGAARFARGEGMWYGNDAVYFCCTNGGQRKKGQIWKYTPSEAEGTPREKELPGKLELFVEPNDAELIENCDNLCVAPWGDLVVCEDGRPAQHLVGISPQGKFYKFGRNAKSGSELAGVCFSPDGSTLFVNLQHDAMTLAITGPWHQKRV